ncbi:MFS transporter [Flammeovirgaceae bacterium SG7u.111]|nr:MFS transporter [Flammeovirgaceae bacterium SG7u.132]WPO38030.1 MFS transporter [Flammeovirgaceae bacterium SG7u.111]
MKTLFKNYINTFKGLSTEVWWLALITLINRAGTMVIPFLSLYLKEGLGFTMNDVGWVMSAFGLGSVAGSWLGGKLTDKVGYYKVMVGSLFASGVLFVALQFANSFATVCLGIFVVMLAADAFRPAIFVALNAYSKPGNSIRSLTLIRLAINLGFSAGPAIGGLIVTGLSYAGLFWVDGVTCILAAFLMVQVLNPKKVKVMETVVNSNPVSPYKDKAYLIFLVAMTLFGFVFLQYFSTITIYYKDIHALSEFQIGLILGLNGFLIFVFEMPLIKWLETTSFSKLGVVFFGAVLTGLSLFVLNLTGWSGVLVIGMLLMTFGEMVAFPYSNAFATDRAKKGNQGEYMALYTISFSIAHVFSHNVGLQMTSRLGFDNTWYIITGIAAVCALLLFSLKRNLLRFKHS